GVWEKILEHLPLFLAQIDDFHLRLEFELTYTRALEAKGEIPVESLKNFRRILGELLASEPEHPEIASIFETIFRLAVEMNEREILETDLKSRMEWGRSHQESITPFQLAYVKSILDRGGEGEALAEALNFAQEVLEADPLHGEGRHLLNRVL